MAKYTLREQICSEIARLLKEERLRQNISLNLLTSQAGLSRQTLSFIETEKRTPTIDTLLRVTEVLGIELEDLIKKARQRALKPQESGRRTSVMRRTVPGAKRATGS